MCRSIKTLRGAAPASTDEVHAAARQFVRKVSGFREPSERNAQAFEAAVAEISAATDRLLTRLPAKKTSEKASERAARPSNGVSRTTPR